MTATLPLSTVVPLPRRSDEAVRDRPTATRRETPPGRYWDVSEARWVSCAGRAAG
jgi:hypothetical protein